MWNPTLGLYMRYGEVGDLLRRVDDRMVIMGLGDELKLFFSAWGLPKSRNGWSRDFLLLVDGWAKDSDANIVYGKSVEPLPFYGMASYPYSDWQHFPDDIGHRKYRTVFNTRLFVPDIAVLRKPN